ncbi:phosphoglycerate mutase family protein [Zeaxanthinibacter sp. PT1]|uniref:SixA phosphatase family protein n=1 Tax=Zeaxanthinibacter TaxID=561554 RepID=UPI0023498280|nr:phosphoglycerate mutase family protein [Zeaxanthinibacter sp. PT1]MDC6351722.1 phosphoglycerate mutase family protein [Zeaxanthinibacter sp. PT1]
MKSLKLLSFSLLFIVLSSSCKDEKTISTVEKEPTVSTYYLIRHAEKDRSNPENSDPELTQKGLGRAMHWAEILDQVPLDAIYSTDFERTSMTAAPAAVKQDITVQYYDPSTLNVEEFKQQTQGMNVLIVGHSNTTPKMVNQLIGEEKYPDMDDYDNGSLFIVQSVGNKTTSQVLEFNCNCPD